jgi:hypothetical protein
MAEHGRKFLELLAGQLARPLYRRDQAPRRVRILTDEPLETGDVVLQAGGAVEAVGDRYQLVRVL